MSILPTSAMIRCKGPGRDGLEVLTVALAAGAPLAYDLVDDLAAVDLLDEVSVARADSQSLNQ